MNISSIMLILIIVSLPACTRWGNCPILNISGPSSVHIGDFAHFEVWAASRNGQNGFNNPEVYLYDNIISVVVPKSVGLDVIIPNGPDIAYRKMTIDYKPNRAGHFTVSAVDFSYDTRDYATFSQVSGISSRSASFSLIVTP